MIVDHEHRFIFIHTEKTGGTSYEKALCEATGMDMDLTRWNEEIVKGAECKHIPASDLRAILGEEIWTSYFKFAVVRNPFDRLLSHWSYHAQLDPKPYWVLEDWIAYPDFPSFVRGLAAKEVHGHPNKQSRMLCDEHGRLLVDHVCRFERLADDFEHVCGRIGVNAPDLPHLLPSRRGRWESVYDEAARQTVYELDAEDFWRFGYATGLVQRETPRVVDAVAEGFAHRLRVDPGDVEALIGLADRYAELHAAESAAILYRAAFERRPDEELLRRARGALASRLVKGPGGA